MMKAVMMCTMCFVKREEEEGEEEEEELPLSIALTHAFFLYYLITFSASIL